MELSLHRKTREKQQLDQLYGWIMEADSRDEFMQHINGMRMGETNKDPKNAIVKVCDDIVKLYKRGGRFL